MMWPFVSDLAAEGFPVARTCRVLKLSRASYYRWLACPVSDWEWKEAHAANALFDAHQDDPEFGYRLLADEIAGAHQVCERTVWRICSQNAWFSVFGKKPYKGSRRPGPPAHDDLVRRRFYASAPNQIWLTDITEHPTRQIPGVVATGLFMRLLVKQIIVRPGCPSRGIFGDVC